MKKQLVIIGNSGAARECYWLAHEIIERESNLEFKGFLSFEGHQGDLRDLAEWSLGTDDNYSPRQEDVFIIGIGMPALRLKAFHKWKDRGARFMNLIHPNVQFIGKVSLGEGNILACGTYISCNAVLGDANYLNGSVVVGHDSRIGDGNFFGPFSMVLGDVSIGSANSFGVRSVVLSGAKIGDGNMVAPGAYLLKGCGNGRVMAGNPAQDMGN
ncbi:acetyltransferase [Desulfovibrio sp. OttesenSCG-928-F20]|nr:acetyltransferase [Desulfovibrio sp. OttesenSCG-928-M16]MDL2291241.1 acetyltransferase [Desulfovibrio sp. OttesenSCG-928-F20]